jgi:hypothetical protein
MIFEKFKSLNNDRMIKATIGMSRERFDQLAIDFTVAFQEHKVDRLRKKEIKRLPAGGLNGVFDSDEKRLFFILFYLKTYPTFDVLGFHFDLSAGHAHDYIKEFMPILKRTLEARNLYPKRAFETIDQFKQAIEKYNETYLDGVEISCVRPQDKEEQSERYSGKKTPYS